MLSDKEQELIAVGASIASGCQPCTRYHFRAARIAGANDEEIRQAVSAALCVRRNATEVMARLGNQPDETKPEIVCCESESPIRELVSISAAYAVNCVSHLETHLTAARQHGVPDDQILAALKIACAVKDMAGKKAQAAAYKAFGRSEPVAASKPPCVFDRNNGMVSAQIIAQGACAETFHTRKEKSDNGKNHQRIQGERNRRRVSG